MKKRHVTLCSAMLLLLGGCSSEAPSTSTHVEAVLYTSRLVAEGSCQWLTCCSSYSQGPFAPGTPGTFVCPGYAPYDNNVGRSGICDPNYTHDDDTQAWAPSFACGGTDFNCDSDNQLWLSG